MRYHTDKNGREIKYCKVRHDDGTVYDVFGTGAYVPGDGDSVMCWRNSFEDGKLPVVWIKTSEVVALRGLLSRLFA